MVRQLGPVTPTAELAEKLNAAGLTTGHGRPFDVKAVQWIRHAYKIPAPAPYGSGEISVTEAARRLGCSTGVIYYWIEAAQLDARRGPGNRLCLRWNDRIEAACRHRIDRSGHLTPQPAAPNPEPAVASPEMSAPLAMLTPADPANPGLTTASNPEHSDIRLQEGQYELIRRDPQVADLAARLGDRPPPDGQGRKVRALRSARNSSRNPSSPRTAST